MNVITVINAKGGCCKSTIAVSLACCLAWRGKRTLLIDCDPQAQVTEWLGTGDGMSDAGTLTQAITITSTTRRNRTLPNSLGDFIRATETKNLSMVASSQGLERVGREIEQENGYETILATLLRQLDGEYDFAVLDSPNQISPVMENTIWPADLFIIPFESAKAVKSYANFYQLVLRIRPGEAPPMLHVLSNLSRLPGLRQRVIDLLDASGLVRAKSEIRSCGWLAQIDERGGDVFDWRPSCNGAQDVSRLTSEVLSVFRKKSGKGLAES